jgi:hypothetical protein
MVDHLPGMRSAKAQLELDFNIAWSSRLTVRVRRSPMCTVLDGDAPQEYTSRMMIQGPTRPYPRAVPFASNHDFDAAKTTLTLPISIISAKTTIGG